MSYYFILLGVILLLVIIGKSLRSTNTIPIIIIIILTLFSGLRYFVGIDYEGYMNTFQDVVNNISVNTKELGFIQLIKFLNLIGAKFQLLFLTVAIITQVFIYKFIKHFSSSFYFSILIYVCISPYYFASFNGARQSMAIAMFLFSIKYIANKEFTKYLILLLFATFFAHLSAALLIPLYYFLNKKLELKKQIYLLVIIFFTSFFIEFIFSLTPYWYYLEMASDRYDINRSLVVYIFILISLLIMVTQYFISDFKYKNIFYNLNLLSIATSLVAVTQSTTVFYMLLMRINNYFFSIYIVFIPLLINTSKNKENRVLFYLLISIILILYFIRTVVFNGENYMIVPYEYNLELF